jgi:radical SAM superfamily enzyme YgiQ (UPF0313 family)
MAKGVLINYSGYPNTPSSLMPDNGLANLAGSLIREGHEATILDYSKIDTLKRLFPHQYKGELCDLVNKVMKSFAKNAQSNLKELDELHNLDNKINELQNEKVREISKEIIEYTKKSNADFVGLKLWTGDGFGGSIRIAEELKRYNPKIPIFAGGPHVDWFREKIYEKTDIFDALAYGEGEETIVGLAEYATGKKRLENIPNLIFRCGKGIIKTKIKRIGDLDQLPSPCYDINVYPAMKGNQKIKIVAFDESRGCNNHCYFCIQPIKSGSLRKRNPVRVVDEMEQMIKKYGINSYKYAGSNTPSDLAESIAKEIIKREINVKYTSFAHVTANQRDFDLLKKSGCFALFYGIESGNQDILDNMNKRIKVEQTKVAITAAKKAGINLVGSIIVPAPFETEETKKQTLELLLELRPDAIPVDPPALMPNTVWARYPDRFNFEMGPDFIQRMMEYKPKIFYSPPLWDPLPYKMNGKPCQAIFKESSEFVQILEREGLVTQIADDILLMANYAGMSARKFRDEMRDYLLTGNYLAVEKMVKKINDTINKF